MPEVLVIADDLTGALEAGAKFAGHGMGAAVVTGRAEAPERPVLVVDTETRHAGAEEAADAVATAVRAHPAPLIYKKTDSTLRGNITAELAALAAALPEARIAYLPAYPAMGRTVHVGRLYVDGVPVEQTAFARDPLNPVAVSSIAELLGEGLPCTVYDGETDDDIAESLAAALADPRCRIFAGPASVAEALAARLAPAGVPAPPWPRIERCLVVNGSLHEASARQMAVAAARGAVSWDTAAAWRAFDPPACDEMLPLEVAFETAGLVCTLLDSSRWDGLLVIGGDTAFAILEALGRPLLEPVGEIVPGVPVSRVAGRELHLVTKAGGFGDEAVLCRVRELLDVQ
jgi:uncharacterized protein YgbK (DUF1537 family)